MPLPCYEQHAVNRKTVLPSWRAARTVRVAGQVRRQPLAEAKISGVFLNRRGLVVGPSCFRLPERRQCRAEQAARNVYVLIAGQRAAVPTALLELDERWAFRRAAVEEVEVKIIQFRYFAVHLF